MAVPSRRWKARVIAARPSRHALSARAWPQSVADGLLALQRWQFQHETVERGAAMGRLWVFAIPVVLARKRIAHAGAPTHRCLGAKRRSIFF